MSKYFDKDFFKFFLGFAVIISISIMIIIATRILEAKSTQTANVVDTLKP